jgi:hypothetical protein
MAKKKSFCCGADLVDGRQCEACGADGRDLTKEKYKNCYLIYDESGYLVCRTDHRAGTPCLMDDRQL